MARRRGLSDRLAAGFLSRRCGTAACSMVVAPTRFGALAGATPAEAFFVKVGLGDRARPVRLLLDTGSSGLFLVERVAKKRGFEPLTRETFFGGGGDQRHLSLRGMFSVFDLGGLRFSQARAELPKTLGPPTPVEDAQQT